MSRSKWCSLVALLQILWAPGLIAGQMTNSKDGVLWQAGIDGVEIEFGPNGSFLRIYSKASQPVRFPDRQGIVKAQMIAEEKAKAAIVRFIEQDSLSVRVVAQVETDFEQATRKQRTSKEDQMSKINKRTLIENLTEVTTSVASGRLRGVIILERGYDEKSEEVWVKVGIGRQSLNAARELDGAIQEPSVTNSPRPGSEVQRSRQKDW